MDPTSAAIPSDSPLADNRSTLTPRRALHIARVTWLVMLVLPFAVFLGALLYMATEQPALAPSWSETWFVIALVYIALVVPAGFFVRARIYRKFWRGGVVTPREYLTGMLAVWGTLEFGGLFSLVGCLLNNHLMPNMLPAALCFVLFTPFWPSGLAMVRPVGTQDDSTVFAHPR
jgi:hypothetical protein